MHRGSSQSRELSKDLFSDAAGSWTAASVMRTLQPGRHTGGQNQASHLAPEVPPPFWCCSGWHQEQAGLSAGKDTRPKQTHTHTHSATLLLRSKRRRAGRAALQKLLFVWRWLSSEWKPLIGVVWWLSPHTGQPLILFCQGFN